MVARLTTLALVFVAAAITSYLDTIAGAWRFLLALGAGTGGVYIIRWFWWRVNAWSEISAMITSFVVSTLLQTVFGMDTNEPLNFAHVMLLTVDISTVVWITVTFLTPPESQTTLKAFYRKVRPGGPLWQPVARTMPEVVPESGLRWDALDWVVGCIFIYATLFGVGKLLLGSTGSGMLLLAIAAAGAGFLSWDIGRRGWARA